jgi:hypothetical protein
VPEKVIHLARLAIERAEVDVGDDDRANLEKAFFHRRPEGLTNVTQPA